MRLFHIDYSPVVRWCGAGKLYVFCNKEPFSAKAVFLQRFFAIIIVYEIF